MAFAMALDARHRYIARVLSQQFSLPVPLVEEVLFQAEQLITLANFFSADGEPSRVIFFHQSRVAAEVDGELAELEEDAPAELFMTTGDIEQLKGHAVYFLRVDESAAVGLNSADTDLSFGVISPNSLEHLQARCHATSGRGGLRVHARISDESLPRLPRGSA